MGYSLALTVGAHDGGSDQVGVNLSWVHLGGGGHWVWVLKAHRVTGLGSGHESRVTLVLDF
jgi:hypothetical protein